ncbi:unnamed protein product [Sphagnum jensenii]|uniref:Pentatricopeptide repeat-containing protein n=1 Tax=Sphagnum jensenii TaxID=128206 RepID=A0ABP1BIN9_9BRYO
MQQRDMFAWTLILAAYAKHGSAKDGFNLYKQLHDAGVRLDALLSNNLIHMYARCGSMKHAHEVFDSMPERDVVSWNTMIAGAAWNGNAEEAFDLFSKMQQENAHLATAVVSMFVKCGSAEDARWVFDKMKVRDIVTWNAMIEGYAKHGPYTKALEVYCQMQDEGFEPNCVTFTCLLNACANLASLQEARWVHARIVEAKLESHLHVANGMMNMFAKCDSTKDARQVFDKMEVRSVISWNTMINGYAECGPYMEAMEIFSQMQHEGVRPDGVTFVGVLSACSHTGLVEEGLRYFYSMSKDYSVTPEVEHVSCLVDLLGRAGYLVEAEEVVNRMPQTPVGATWGALLGACRLHGNVKLAERAAQFWTQLEPQNAEVYVSLAHIYLTASLWQEAMAIQKLMGDRDLRRQGPVGLR